MDGLKARLSFDAVAYDYDDEYLTIDTDTHTININNVSRLFGVQYDGNSKLIKFRVRNKLSDIQKMQDSIVYINWIDSRGVKGQSIAINKTINNDTCEFAWKVPFDALKNSGVLHFAMSAVMTKNSSSVIDQRWSTQIASVITPDGIYIKSYTPSSEEEDRIAQIYNELSKMINKQSDNLSNLQTQVNQLNEALVDIALGYIITPAKYDIQGYIGETGTVVQTEGFNCTDYIPVKYGTIISGKSVQVSNNLGIVAFYDNDKKLIYRYTGPKSDTTQLIDFTVSAPYQCKYIRLSTTYKEPYNIQDQYATYSNIDANLLEALANNELSYSLKDIPMFKIGYIDAYGILYDKTGRWSGYIPITQGTRIYGNGKSILGNSAIYYFYDSDKKPICGYTGTKTGEQYDYEEYDVIAPDKSAYVAFSRGGYDYSSHANVDWNVIKYINSKEPIKFYVGYNKTGTNYFNSLTECMWKVSKMSGEKEIHINAGTYDVLEELGGMPYILSKNINNNNFKEVHPFVTDTKIIGHGNVVLNFLLDDNTPYNNYWLFSCLGINGNCTIENIEIYAKNCRYCIHDESGSDYPNTSRHYKNVRCHHYGNDSSACGCGYSNNTVVNIDNCIFESEIGHGWSCHANNGCSFIFNNTAFYSDNYHKSCRISQNGQAYLTANLSNCFLLTGLEIRNEWTEPSIYGDTKIDLINTYVKELLSNYSKVNKEITSFNTLTGEKKIILAKNK